MPSNRDNLLNAELTKPRVFLMIIIVVLEMRLVVINCYLVNQMKPFTYEEYLYSN